MEDQQPIKPEQQDDEILADEDNNDDDIPWDNSLLPAWFTGRMMDDWWHFGLLMITGDVMAIHHIDNIKQDATGNLWLDATLIDNFIHEEVNGHRLFMSPTSRSKISINSSHVVAAFELADT